MYRHTYDATIRTQSFTQIYGVLSAAPYHEYYNKDLTLCVLSSEVEDVFSRTYEIVGHYSTRYFVTLVTSLGITPSASQKLMG
jgi:hypothetical protein